jgi:hypothetical protein
LFFLSLLLQRRRRRKQYVLSAFRSISTFKNNYGDERERKALRIPRILTLRRQFLQQRREDRNYLRLVYPSPLTSAPRDPLEDAEPPTRPGSAATCRGVQSYSSTSARTQPSTSYGFVKWSLFAPILGMHVRLEFDHEKLHDLQIPIRCGEVE